MAAFKDLKTPREIRNYLLDVIDRTLKADRNACLYHYTDFTSIFNIISSGYLWLGSTQKMNDYLEGEYIEAIDGKHRVYSVCFSRAEENLALYKMYAPNPNGAMMVFPLSLAQRMIDELPDSKESNKLVRVVRDNTLTKETAPAGLYWAAVAYKDLHEDTLRLNNARNDAVENPLSVRELAGFIKLHGWEFEKEVRLVASLVKELEDNEKVAVKLPEGFTKQIQVVTGPAFDKMIHRSEMANLKRLGVSMHESEYDALVDLGGSLNDEAGKHILALEKENTELKNKVKALEEDQINKTKALDDNEYRRKFKELKNNAVFVLSFYGNVFTNIVEDPDEEHEEASKALRKIGVDFEVFSTNEPRNYSEIPKNSELKRVSGEFIGLSNSMYIYRGGDRTQLLDDNLRRVETIKGILGL